MSTSYLVLQAGPDCLPIAVDDPPAGSQPIDAQWKADNAAAFGGPPYVVGAPFDNTSGGGNAYSVPSNGSYYLAEGMTTPGTAIVVSGSSPVTLYLNGHAIDYDTVARPTVPNAFFASDAIGAGPTITGWTIAGPGASSAIVADVADGPLQFPFAGHFGTQCLKVTCPAALAATASIGSGGFATFTTSVAHGLSTGDYAFLRGFSTTPDVTLDVHPVTVISSTVFQCQDVSPSAISGASGTLSAAVVVTSSDTTIAESGQYYCGQIQTANEGSDTTPHLVRTRLLQGGAELAEMSQFNDQVQASLTNGTYVNFWNATAVSVASVASTSPLQVRTYVGNASASGTMDLFLSRAMIAKAYCPGILCYLQGDSQVPPGDHMPAGVVARIDNSGGLTLMDGPSGPKGGSLNQGAGRGFRSHPIQWLSPGGLAAYDAAITATGDDVIAVCTQGVPGSGPSITAGAVGRGLNIAYSRAAPSDVHITNRGTINPAIYLYGSGTGTLTAVGNTITDAPHGGITQQFQADWSGTLTASSNTIYPRTVVPNGYSVGIVKNATVTDNTIDSISQSGGGRGIYFGGAGGIYGNVTISNNNVSISEWQYPETFDVSARGIRVRNDENGLSTDAVLQDVAIEGNDVLAVVGAGDAQSDAYAFWLSSLIPARGIGSGWDNNSGSSMAVIGSALQLTDFYAAYWGVSGSFEAYLSGFTTTPDINGLRTLTFVSGQTWEVSGVSVSSITDAHGLVAYKPRADIMNTADNIRVEDNTFRAIALSDFAGTRNVGAIALWDCCNTGLTLANNALASNVQGIEIITYDAGSVDAPIAVSGSTITLDTTYPGAGTFTFHSLYTAHTATGTVTMTGTTFAGGASDSAVAFNDAIPQSVTWVYEVAVTVTQGGSPLAGATIQIKNNAGTVDSSGTTDANGQVTLTAIARLQTGTSTPATTEYGPHTAVVVSPSGSQSLGMLRANTTATFTF